MTTENSVSAMSGDDFDWSSDSCSGHTYERELSYQMFQAPVNESHYDRALRMIRQLQRACMACSMCELGRKGATKDGKLMLDPHVFSNQNPTRFMIVGQNPGWTELEKCEPFVGQAGENFDIEIIKHGLSRDDFYICNVVRCWTANNMKPLYEHCERCEPFLRMEINTIRPLLVVTLGALAFGQLCPGVAYSDGLGDIINSSKYDVPVYAIYHPSPLNFREPGRLEEFKSQVKIMCGLVKALRDT